MDKGSHFDFSRVSTRPLKSLWSFNSALKESLESTFLLISSWRIIIFMTPITHRYLTIIFRGHPSRPKEILLHPSHFLRLIHTFPYLTLALPTPTISSFFSLSLSSFHTTWVRGATQECFEVSIRVLRGVSTVYRWRRGRRWAALCRPPSPHPWECPAPARVYLSVQNR